MHHLSACPAIMFKIALFVVVATSGCSAFGEDSSAQYPFYYEFSEGIYAYQMKDYEEAKKLFLKALETYPVVPSIPIYEALEDLGYIEFNQGDYESAKRHLGLLLQLTKGGHYYNRAIFKYVEVLQKLGEEEQAKLYGGMARGMFPKGIERKKEWHFTSSSPKYYKTHIRDFFMKRYGGGTKYAGACVRYRISRDGAITQCTLQQHSQDPNDDAKLVEDIKQMTVIPFPESMTELEIEDSVCF